MMPVRMKMRAAAPAVSAALLLLLPAARAQGLHMPSQASYDADYWPRLPSGGSRPFISDFSVNTGGVSTTMWSGATSAATSPPANWEATANRLSAVISPTNMCSSSQVPAPNLCYASPNRVAIALGVTSANNGGLDMDFASATESPAVDATSAFHLTINLGAYANDYAWSWVNGGVTYWNVSNGVMHLVVSPVSTPDIDWTTVAQPQCCTCDVPANCNVARARGSTLTASFFFQTAPTAPSTNPLQGAVFATTGAVMGALTLNPNVRGGSLDYAMASAHLAADGSPMLGTLNGYLPASAITAVFPSVPLVSVPRLLNVIRAGDPGSESAATVTAVAAASFGSDGFLVTVTGATFSAPTYRVTAGSSSAAPSMRAATGAALLAAVAAMLL